MKDYLQAYIAPLLEETRAELSSCLEAISFAPSFKIQCIEEAQGSGLLYSVDLDCSSDESCGTSYDYRSRNGDLYILSSIRLETPDDLRRYGVTVCMVLVTEVAMVDAFQRGLKVKSSKNIDTENDVANYQYATFLANITTNARIWKAVHFSAEMKNNFDVIKAVLHPNRFVYFLFFFL